MFHCCKKRSSCHVVDCLYMSKIVVCLWVVDVTAESVLISEIDRMQQI